MAAQGGSIISGWFANVAGRLRFPQLFALTAGLFLLDLFVPDLLPFADEIILGLATVLLGSLRRRPRTEGAGDTASNGKVIDVDPE